MRADDKRRSAEEPAAQGVATSQRSDDAVWSDDVIVKFKSILKQNPSSAYAGRTERFAAVSRDMGGGSFGKRACYAQYKLMQHSSDDAPATGGDAIEAGRILESKPVAEVAAPKPTARGGWSSFGVNDAAPTAGAPTASDSRRRPAAEGQQSSRSSGGGWLAGPDSGGDSDADANEADAPSRTASRTSARSTGGGGWSSAPSAVDARGSSGGGGWGAGGGGGGWSSFGSEATAPPSRSSADPPPSAAASCPFDDRSGASARIEDVSALWWRVGGSSPDGARLPSVHRISRTEAASLRRVTIGSRRPWAASWSDQGFFFNRNEGLGYGLVQRHGGPCGVLAAVQTHIIKWLARLDPSPKSADEQHREPAWFNPSVEALRTALLEALTDIVWRCANKESGTCCVAVRGDRGRPSATGGDGTGSATALPRGGVESFTEQLSVYRDLASRSSVRALFDNDDVLSHFADPTGGGVILVVYSAVLSHGVRTVAEEVSTKLGGGESGGDDALVGGHDYAGQELVNLLIAGAAVPQVFNGTKEIDGVVLRGVDSRCEVGLLSLYEALNPGFVEVGSHLKSPQLPLWIVCSEDHYMVLFGLDADATGLELEASVEPAAPFPLYFYDELASQDEIIKLGITPRPDVPLTAAEKGDDDTELVSPIDHCIRTRWREARIDWGDVDPLM